MKTLLPWLRTSLAALASMAALSAQTPFRGGTELVSVYTTVQDRNSRLVPDLRQEDFVVTDNGKEQPLTFFSNTVSPFSVVIMLDRSGSMVQHRDVIRDAAAAFVAEMLPADRARIGSIGTRITIAPPDFTSSHQDLLDVLSRPAGGGGSPVWVSVDQSITALHGLGGRRVILLLSDGHDESAGSYPRTPFKAVAERIRRADVMVYAVGFAAIDTSGGRPKIDRPDDKLHELADLSGGGYFEMSNTADLKGLFRRVAEELHHQYWLGFEPKKRDGKLHQIRVRLKRPGMIARARQSYLAPSAR